MKIQAFYYEKASEGILVIYGSEKGIEELGK
jgi:hypothetical protein